MPNQIHNGRSVNENSDTTSCLSKWKNLKDCQYTIGKAVRNKQSQSISIAYKNAKLETLRRET